MGSPTGILFSRCGLFQLSKELPAFSSGRKPSNACLVFKHAFSPVGVRLCRCAVYHCDSFRALLVWGCNSPPLSLVEERQYLQTRFCLVLLEHKEYYRFLKSGGSSFSGCLNLFSFPREFEDFYKVFLGLCPLVRCLKIFSNKND